MGNQAKRSRLWVAVAGCAAMLGVLASTGEAQTTTYDHLECYRLRDRGRATTPWTANAHGNDALSVTPKPGFVPPFAVEAGCRLLPRNRAVPREVCVAVSKAPAQPPTGANLTNALACYDVSCPAPSANQDIQLTNQFGSGVATVRQRSVHRTVCVPATNP